MQTNKALNISNNVCIQNINRKEELCELKEVNGICMHNFISLVAYMVRLPYVVCHNMTLWWWSEKKVSKSEQEGDIQHKERVAFY